MGSSTSFHVQSAAPRAARGRVECEVVEANHVDAVIPQWDACAAGAGNHFAQAPGFASTVWRHELAGRGDLAVVAGRDATGTLRALLPLWLVRPRMPVLGLRLLQPVALHGQETSTVLVGDADRAAATVEIADFLLGPGAPPYDVLHLPAIDPGSLLFAAVVDAAQRHELPVVTGIPVRGAVIRPAADGAPRSGSACCGAGGDRRSTGPDGVELVCREISWEWHQHRDAIEAIGRQDSPAHGPTVAEEPTLAAVGALLGRLDRHFRAHAFGAFAAGRLAAWAVCFRGGAAAELWRCAVDPRFAPLGVRRLLQDHCRQEVARWPGVERIAFPPLDDGRAEDSTEGARTVCELTVVRATGLRRRRALARFGAGAGPAADGPA